MKDNLTKEFKPTSWSIDNKVSIYGHHYYRARRKCPYLYIASKGTIPGSGVPAVLYQHDDTMVQPRRIWKRW